MSAGREGFPASGTAQTFAHDSLNRIKSVTETGGTAASWAYAYDPMGNWTSVTRTGATGATGNETAAYNAASELTSNTYGALTYDKNGNELTAPAGQVGAGIPARSGQVIDAVGNVTAMTVAGAALPFSYGGTDPGFYNQVLSAHGSTYQRSTLGLALSSQTVGGKTIRYLTHPSGVNIGYIAPEGQAWFLTDRLGTIIALANDAGALIGRYSYDPTGIPRATSETTTAAGYNIHRYAAGLLDKTTGLTRFGVRWYNPATGRYTTPDPSGKEKNTYLYAGGNCINRVDPTGEAKCEDLAPYALFGVTLVTGSWLMAAPPAVGYAAGGALGAGSLPGMNVWGAVWDAGCRGNPPTGPGGWQNMGGTQCQVNPSTGVYWCH